MQALHLQQKVDDLVFELDSRDRELNEMSQSHAAQLQRWVFGEAFRFSADQRDVIMLGN